MRYFAACALGLSLLFGCKAPTGGATPAASQPRAALATPLPRDYDQLRERMRQTIPKAMEEHGAASISIAVVDGQDLVWVDSFGLARREGETPATTDTLYEVGSISKPFVGLAVMQLVEAGKLDLDAPLTDYLPEFEIQSRFGGERVPTLRQLLSHQSGMPSDLRGSTERDDYAISQLPDALKSEWLVQPPGRMAIYSSLGVDLAALVVERRTGQEFSTFLEHAVLEPLGMPRASLRAEQASATERAAGYDWAGQPAKPMGYAPSASMRASVTELAQLVRWVNGRGRVGDSVLLSADGVTEMMRPQNADRALDLGALVGLTWFIRPGSEATGDIVWHTGSTAGFMAYVGIAPKHGVGVVVLGNNASFAVPGIAEDALALAVQVEAGLDLATETRGIDAIVPAPSTKIDARRLDQIAAVEYSDGTTRYRFEHHRGGLRAPLPGRRTLFLTPRPDGTFDAEARMLGIAAGEPFPVQRVSFETIDGEQVMVARGTRAAWVFAKRFEAGLVSERWRARVGTYRPSGDAMGLVEAVDLAVEDGALRVEVHVPGGSEAVPFVLEVHSDDMATVAGLGRRSGRAVVAFEREGRHFLRSEGFEFIRQ